MIGAEEPCCGRRGCTNCAVAYIDRDGTTVVVCGSHTDDGEIVEYV